MKHLIDVGCRDCGRFLKIEINSGKDGMIECDDCGDMIFEGERAFTCHKCDFDLCEDCVESP